MFALRAAGAATHVASFGNSGERPQGAVKAPGQELHWHQATERAFTIYRQCRAICRVMEFLVRLGYAGHAEKWVSRHLRPPPWKPPPCGLNRPPH